MSFARLDIEQGDSNGSLSPNSSLVGISEWGLCALMNGSKRNASSGSKLEFLR
jgi:hypothetical protein